MGFRVVGSKVGTKLAPETRYGASQKWGYHFGGLHIIWIIVCQYISWEQTTVELSYSRLYWLKAQERNWGL